uniref:WD_REPEATS_REGION domain-containing protein n=1 Tax=Macrostomum lignano TaxID=282301 RepID=A0A1I8JGK8_9PLAT
VAFSKLLAKYHSKLAAGLSPDVSIVKVLRIDFGMLLLLDCRSRLHVWRQMVLVLMMMVMTAVAMVMVMRQVQMEMMIPMVMDKGSCSMSCLGFCGGCCVDVDSCRSAPLQVPGGVRCSANSRSRSPEPSRRIIRVGSCSSSFEPNSSATAVSAGIMSTMALMMVLLMTAASAVSMLLFIAQSDAVTVVTDLSGHAVRRVRPHNVGFGDICGIGGNAAFVFVSSGNKIAAFSKATWQMKTVITLSQLPDARLGNPTTHDNCILEVIRCTECASTPSSLPGSAFRPPNSLISQLMSPLTAEAACFPGWDVTVGSRVPTEAQLDALDVVVIHSAHADQFDNATQGGSQLVADPAVHHLGDDAGHGFADRAQHLRFESAANGDAQAAQTVQADLAQDGAGAGNSQIVGDAEESAEILQSGFDASCDLDAAPGHASSQGASDVGPEEALQGEHGARLAQRGVASAPHGGQIAQLAVDGGGALDPDEADLLAEANLLVQHADHVGVGVAQVLGEALEQGVHLLIGQDHVAVGGAGQSQGQSGDAEMLHLLVIASLCLTSLAGPAQHSSPQIQANQQMDAIIRVLTKTLKETNNHIVNVVDEKISFSKKVLLVTITGSASIFGQLGDLSTLRRVGDAHLSLSGRVMTLQGVFGADIGGNLKAAVSWNGIDVAAGVGVTLKDFRAFMRATQNLGSPGSIPDLQEVRLQSIGALSLSILGLGVLEWVFGPISNAMLDILIKVMDSWVGTQLFNILKTVTSANWSVGLIWQIN